MSDRPHVMVLSGLISKQCQIVPMSWYYQDSSPSNVRSSPCHGIIRTHLQAMSDRPHVMVLSGLISKQCQIVPMPWYYQDSSPSNVRSSPCHGIIRTHLQAMSDRPHVRLGMSYTNTIAPSHQFNFRFSYILPAIRKKFYRITTGGGGGGGGGQTRSRATTLLLSKQFFYCINSIENRLP